VKLDLSERFIESHHIGEWPLISSHFSCWSSHENSSKLVDNQKFSNIKRICP